MPRAEILSTQAIHTLNQLHAELAGKLIDNKSEARRLTAAMKQVEAVMKLLQPGYDVRLVQARDAIPPPMQRLRMKKGGRPQPPANVLRLCCASPV
jgi:hypothetical protein